MNLSFILAIVLVPVIAGGVIFFFIFRRVKRKYLSMFENLILLAKNHPEELSKLLAGSENDTETMISTMAAIRTVSRVDIVKAGRSITTLYLHATKEPDGDSSHEIAIYEVLLQLDGQWSIRRFVQV